jgi:phosphate-selective porin OprO/OprP
MFPTTCIHRALRFVTMFSTALSVLSFARPALAAMEADDAALRQELEALKIRVNAQDQEIAELRRAGDPQWMTEQRSAEIRELVEEVLADADTRASLLESGLTAGYDGKHFFLASADGNYRMNIGGYMQVRYLANFREDSGSDDTETGFQLRRAKLEFFGNVIAPQFIYSMQLEVNRDTGEVGMDRGYVGYVFNDDLSILAGRFKGPLLHEEFLVSATRQLAVERSLVNAIFSINYVDGAMLVASPNDWLNLNLSVNDGLRSGDPGGTGNDFASDTSDIAFTGRADVKLMGEWPQLKDFNAWEGQATSAFIGAAAHYELSESGDTQTAVPAADSFVTYTSDATLYAGGFEVFGAFVGRHVDLVDAAPVPSYDDFGVVVQGGYMVVPDKFEPFVRYEWIGPDSDRGLNDMNLITAGANYFFKKNSAKLTADVVWALDELNSFAFSTPTSRTGLGLLPDAPGAENQVVIRVQFQLVF